MTKEEKDKAVNRVNQIDSMFKNATRWESWMDALAVERKKLVDNLKKHGVQIEHNYELELNWKK